MTQNKLFQTAVKKAKAGERLQARRLLLELVETNPQHELAWLWLSELVDDPEDKIIALENALTINPNRTQAATRLQKLHEKYNLAYQKNPERFSPNGIHANIDAVILTTEEESRFNKINALFKANKLSQGRQALAEFLRRYANHEPGWWLMVQNADSQANLLTALDHLLRLNAHHPGAPGYVDRIQPTSEQFLQMGRLNERLERWDAAIHYYKRALKSPSNADRLLAKKRLPQAEIQLKLSKIKATRPITTVLRMAMGPTILYTTLILVQAGLNPLQVSPLLCFGNVALLLGLLLLGGLSHVPDHLWLRQLSETAVFQSHQSKRLLGLVLLWLPIVLLLLHAITRLLTFNLDLTSL